MPKGFDTKKQHVWFRGPGGTPDRVQVLMGTVEPRVVDGYNKINIVDRPFRRGIPEWDGTNPIAIEFSVMFIDLDDPGTTVEADIRQLEVFAGLAGDGVKPPPLIIDANGAIPHDYTNASQLRWLIENVEWGTPDINFGGSNRWKQECTLKIRQIEEDDLLSQVSPAKKRAKKKSTGKKGGSGASTRDAATYTVKAGDTLMSIASAKLHDESKWRELKKINNIRDPRALRVGQNLKLR